MNDPNLQDLPFKIELNEWGQIIMSPTKLLHSILQKRILELLDVLLEDGEAFTECPIQTRKGIRVADVVWVSDERMPDARDEVFNTAPEICVEVVSPSNKREEMQEKIGLYLEAGALEVWTCDQKGKLGFFDAAGKLRRSRLMPDFPRQITVQKKRN